MTSELYTSYSLEQAESFRFDVGSCELVIRQLVHWTLRYLH